LLIGLFWESCTLQAPMVYRYFATKLFSQRWLERMNGMTTKHIEEAQQKPSRREIAAMAMQGLLANSNLVNGSTTSLIADWAVDHADALIARLSADPVAEGVNLLPMYSRELDEGLTDEPDRGVSR
jgi:hypothetical protein